MHQIDPLDRFRIPPATEIDLAEATTRYRAAVDAHNAAFARLLDARRARADAEKEKDTTRQAQDEAFGVLHRAALAGRDLASW